MQKIIIYKCGNEASSTKNIFSQLSPAERFHDISIFSKAGKSAIIFFGHRLAGEHLSETQICRSPYYLWNRNCKTVSRVHTVPLISIKSGPFLADQVLFRSQSETHQHMYIAIFSIGYLQFSDQPYLLISQLDSETPVYGCKS